MTSAMCVSQSINSFKGSSFLILRGQMSLLDHNNRPAPIHRVYIHSQPRVALVQENIAPQKNKLKNRESV